MSPRQSSPGQRRRHSGEAAHRAHVGDHAAAVDQGAMIDKQENRRLRRRKSSNAVARQGTPTRLREHRREFGRWRG